MAVNRKYADLPDLDSAPDIYETPELTDDVSTVPTTTGPPHSENEFEDDDEDAAGVSHSRLQVDQARSRFLRARIDARDADFSDRLDDKRKSYRAANRRLEEGRQEIGDLSDEEPPEEGLRSKIARLMREAQEAQSEYERLKAEGKDPIDGDEKDLFLLSELLDQLPSLSNEHSTAKAYYARAATQGTLAPEQPSNEPTKQTDGHATYTVAYAPNYEESHALAKAADFDRRLVLLEKAIGVTSTGLELQNHGGSRAIMPTIDTLQKQILTLSEASTSSLDSISRRVRTLTQEAEQLEKSRKAARAAQDNLASPTTPAAVAETSEHTAKVNALYGTLPTIEHLTPMLPPLMDRLRSLRAIHADAATANETLDYIENKQTEMASELTKWREVVEKVEAHVGAAETSFAGNIETWEGAVKELEAKLAKLS
ncbi:Dynamitin-domain-containing protein [Xylariomycetidae sp. FL0641]|nr:Dynamitin-domain-containing protein [Xylariomycetidae sp. FL0641]